MALQDLTFVGADSSFTSLILGLYRNIEEQIMGRKNRVSQLRKAFLDTRLPILAV